MEQSDRGDACVLSALHSDLVRFARGELFTWHLNIQLAEDLLSDAVVRWLRARIQYRSPAQARAWFRTTLRRMVVDRVRRRSHDVLDQVGVLSLDEPWARGE